METNSNQDQTTIDDEFSAGFDENEAGQAELPGGSTDEGNAPDPVKHQEAPAPAPYVEQPVIQPPADVPQVPVQQAQPAPTATVEQPPVPVVKTVEMPEHIQAEWDALKKINPEAAALAMEDSSEGEAVRARLENYGADIASDRAEATLRVRKQEAQAQTAERQRQQAATDAHNRNFVTTLTREVPDYTAMMQNPARQQEAAAYTQQIMTWIQSKPYAEAAPLMEVAQRGTDPMQIAGLVKQFEVERKKPPSQVKKDFSGALAVPGRGAPVVPAGIGDKDDYEAGWNANPSN